MQPILDLPPTLLPHDAVALAPVAHRVIAEWPEGTFLENLVVLPDGDVVISVLSEARLDRVSTNGAVRVLHRFNAPPTGIALVDGFLFVAVGEPGCAAPTLWRLDPQSGDAKPWMELNTIQFANGVTPFAPGQLLIADSWQGRLVRVDLAAGRCATWYEDERLTRASGIEFLPGANGVKRFGHEVTVSSNGRALLLRIQVAEDGSALGPAAVIAERLRVDDLAYDSAGRLYLCTHIGHTVDRLDRHGTRVSLAGPEQGAAGSTACAFDRDGGLLVTTTGGILAPPNRQLEPAKLLRLETGSLGHDLDKAWEPPT